MASPKLWFDVITDPKVITDYMIKQIDMLELLNFSEYKIKLRISWTLNHKLDGMTEWKTVRHYKKNEEHVEKTGKRTYLE